MAENRKLNDRELGNINGGTSESTSQDIVVVREILAPSEFIHSVYDGEGKLNHAKKSGYRIYEIKGLQNSFYASAENYLFPCGLVPGDRVVLDYFRDGLFGWEIVEKL